MRDKPVVAAPDHEKAESRRHPERVEANAEYRRVVDHNHPPLLDGNLVAAVGQISKIFPDRLAPDIDLWLGCALQDGIRRMCRCTGPMSCMSPYA